jgi:hypothetical protein
LTCTDNLSSVVIPANVTSIGSSAFANCTSLASVRILTNSPPTLVGSDWFKSISSTIIRVPTPISAAWVAQGISFAGLTIST